jgi:hypothetical protein
MKGKYPAQNAALWLGNEAACRVSVSGFILLIALACFAGGSRQAPAQELGPLKISATGRYLVNVDNRPFLVVGDTAWSLIAQAREAEIERYLDDRQKRGFNSIIVNLIEHKFCDAPPKTRSGLAPFAKPGDFSTPVADYFDFAAKVIQKANQRGIVVWLAPAYLGYGGGDEGFFREIKAGGKERLRAYGKFVGDRYRDIPNIIWILGGDYTPEMADRWTITELGRAIYEQDTNHLMTVHAAPETSVSTIFGTEKWLRVTALYSYDKELFRRALAEYARTPVRPFVLIESTYEGEHNSTQGQIRRQAYWAMLSGGCGQFLGNNPIWHFDGPGLFSANQTWLEALSSPGSLDMARLRRCFLELPWPELRPEENHTVVTDGYGEGVATCLTALTPDHGLSVTYIPSTGTDPRQLTVSLAGFPKSVSARWYNPTTGNFSDAQGSPSSKRGVQQFRTPGENGKAANDWLLILSAR